LFEGLDAALQPIQLEQHGVGGSARTSASGAVAGSGSDGVAKPPPEPWHREGDVSENATSLCQKNDPTGRVVDTSWHLLQRESRNALLCKAPPNGGAPRRA
jgi:hypothetical protein